MLLYLLVQGEDSCHGDNLADNVVLKQFLEKIILGKMNGVGSEVMEDAMVTTHSTISRDKLH